MYTQIYTLTSFYPTNLPQEAIREHIMTILLIVVAVFGLAYLSECRKDNKNKNQVNIGYGPSRSCTDMSTTYCNHQLPTL